MNIIIFPANVVPETIIRRTGCGYKGTNAAYQRVLLGVAWYSIIINHEHRNFLEGH